MPPRLSPGRSSRCPSGYRVIDANGSLGPAALRRVADASIALSMLPVRPRQILPSKSIRPMMEYRKPIQYQYGLELSLVRPLVNHPCLQVSTRELANGDNQTLPPDSPWALACRVTTIISANATATNIARFICAAPCLGALEANEHVVVSFEPTWQMPVECANYNGD